MLGVVLFYGGSLSVDEFEAGHFESAEFDSADDFAIEVSGYSAWFDEDEGGFHMSDGGYRGLF